MRLVLYTQDFEPITVLELPLYLLEQMERYGGVRVAVHKPPSWEREDEPPHQEPPDILEIYCHRLRWQDGSVKTVLTTDNDELALSLRPDWLPGQLQAIQWYQEAISSLVRQLKQKFKKD